MSEMFCNAKVFNQPIGHCNVSKAITMNKMFNNAKSFNQPIGHWNVKNVSYMALMFYEAQSFNQDLSGWDVSNVKDMEYMFVSATSFQQNLSTWKLKSITHKPERAFYNYPQDKIPVSTGIPWIDDETITPEIPWRNEGDRSCDGVKAKTGNKTWRIKNGQGMKLHKKGKCYDVALLAEHLKSAKQKHKDPLYIHKLTK